MNFLNLLITGFIFGLLTYCVCWIIELFRFRKHVNKFPGTPANFFLGHMLTLSRDRGICFKQFREFATKFSEGYRMYGGLYGAFNFVKAMDFELILSSVKYIEKQSIYLPLTNWLKQGLLTSSGTKWHHRRKILTPAFHFNVLRRFVKIFGEHTENFIQILKNECNKDKTNIVPLFSELTLEIICETAMGVRLDKNNKKQELYRENIKLIAELMVERVITPWYYFDLIYQFFPVGRLFNKTIKQLHQFTNDVIKERESNFHDSDVENLDKEENNTAFGKKKFAMLDLLISVKRATKEIDDDGIREEVDTFMFEGHDTTSVALTFIILCLANYKDVQEKVRQEVDAIFQNSLRPASYNDLQKMQYLEMVIKETLRIYPSVPLISRTMQEDVPCRGGKYLIPKTCFTHLHIYDLHRDPEHFPEPEKFDPDRFLPENSNNRHPYCYVPFSAGPRNCIGQKFAMLELKNVVSSILRYFIIEQIDTRESIKILTDLVLRPEEVNVKFRQRKFIENNIVYEL